jgi:hypothetical protein
MGGQSHHGDKVLLTLPKETILELIPRLRSDAKLPFSKRSFSMVSFSPRKWSRFSCLRPVRGQYRRAEQLPPLLKLWPKDVDDYSYPGTLRIAALLRKALRAERNRARTSHWAYDLNRHLGLIDALKAERARLAALAPALPRRAAGSNGGDKSGRIAGTLRLPAGRERIYTEAP